MAAALFGVPAVAWAQDPAGLMTVGGPTAFAPFSSGMAGDSPQARAQMKRLGERKHAEEKKRKAELASPRARAERQKSRTAHHSLSDGAAVQLLRSKFSEELKAPVPDAETLFGGDRVTEFRSDYVAVVDGAGDRPSRLIDSQVALRAPDSDLAGAEKAPVDLDLVAAGGGFEADNGLARVKLPAEASDGIQVGPATVKPGGRAGVERVDSDTLAYPNIATDTDLAINVTPTGFETYHQIRGPAAPETQRLALALPAGSSLRAVEGGGAEVVRRTDSVLSVSPPRAVDAQGAEVPSSYAVEGDTLVIKTPHRDRSVAYPVLVDPEFTVKEDWACTTGPVCNATWFHGNPTALDGLRHWNFYTDYNNVAGYEGNTFAGRKSCYRDSMVDTCYRPGNGGPSPQYTDQPDGLHVLVRPYFYYPGSKIGEYVYQPPGTTTQIYRADFGAKFLRTRGSGNPFMFTGIYSYADWNWVQIQGFTTDLTHHWNAHFGSSRPGPQAAGFGFVSWGDSYYSQWRDGYMGAAIIELTDPEAPTLNGINMTGPATWTKDATFTFAPSASDNGLGIRRFRLSATGIADQDRWVWCNGTKSAPCLQTFALNASRPDGDPYAPFRINAASLPEGQQNINIKASDALAGPGHDTSQSATVKIDRTAPTISPEPTGPLYENRNRTDDHRREGLYGAEAAIHVEAKDDPTDPANSRARSGTQTVALWVDKNRDSSWSPDEKVKTAANATCTTTQCPNGLSLDYSLATDPLADGDYKVKLEATDQAGNTSPAKEWTVTVDRRGDVYSAEEFDGPPSDSISPSGTETFKLGGWEARHADDETTSTRHSVACAASASGVCGETRTLAGSGEEDQAPQYVAYRGTSEGDARLDRVSNAADATHEQLGSPTSSQSLDATLTARQQPPPSHDSTVDLYVTDVTSEVDGNPATVKRERWIDRATKLMLRERRTAAAEVESDTYYSYGKSRKEVSELPSDTFALLPPQGSPAPVQYPPEPQAGPEDSPPTHQDLVDQSRDFREMFGLDVTAAHIEDVLANPALERTISQFGVPLTASEEQEMSQRDAASGGSADQLVSWIQANAVENFAGVWIDQKAGGLVRVGFTQDAESMLSTLKAHFDFADRLRTFTATYTLVQLQALLDRVQADRATLSDEGVDITTLTIREDANRVELGVANLTPAQQTTLVERYGAAVSVVSRAPFVNFEYARNLWPIGPAFAGIGIISSSNENCSTGFIVRKARHIRLLTAGHCGGRGTSWVHFDGGTSRKEQRYIGRTNASRDIRGFDASLIKITNPSLKTRRLLTSAAGGGHYQIIRNIKRKPLYGTRICFVGIRARGTRCGTHQLRDPDGFEGIITSGSNRGNFGDSGGPVFHGDLADGIVSGGDDPGRRILRYTPMSKIADRYGVELLGR